MKRFVKVGIASVACISFVLFFFFIPAVYTPGLWCPANSNGYTSLSFHFFGTGEIYLGRSFIRWGHGIPFCY